MTFLQKIRIDPLHGLIFLRRFQFLWLFRFFSFLCLFFFYSLPSFPSFCQFSFCLLPFFPFNKLPLFSVQQIAHRLRVRHPEELLHKINGMASDLSAVAVPTAPPKSHTPVPFPTPFIPGTLHFLMLPAKDVRNLYCIGPLLLFLCKINKISQSYLLSSFLPLLLWSLCLYHVLMVIHGMSLCNLLLPDFSCQLSVNPLPASSTLSSSHILFDDMFQMPHEPCCH